MSNQKIDNLKDDVQKLELQLREKKRELKEEEKRAKKSRNDKLEQFAQDFITVVNNRDMAKTPDNWEEKDGDWVHEGLLGDESRFGWYHVPQGIYLSGFYTRKEQPTACSIDYEYVDKVALTIVADAFDPEVQSLIYKLYQ